MARFPRVEYRLRRGNPPFTSRLAQVHHVQLLAAPIPFRTGMAISGHDKGMVHDPDTLLQHLRPVRLVAVARTASMRFPRISKRAEYAHSRLRHHRMASRRYLNRLFSKLIWWDRGSRAVYLVLLRAVGTLAAWVGGPQNARRLRNIREGPPPPVQRLQYQRCEPWLHYITVRQAAATTPPAL